MERKHALKVSRHEIFAGLLGWTSFSYILYAFFYMLRESFRMLTAVGTVSGYRPLLVLDDSEQFIYNLFYASIASAIGFLFSLRLFLQWISKNQERRTKYFIRNTLHDQEYLTWPFLFWFGKLGSFLGVCFLMLYLQFELSFAIDLPLFLVLLPIVLFLGIWPALSRVIRYKRIRVLGMLLTVFLSMSLLFSQKDFIDVDQVNHGLLKHNIDYAYSLEVPKSYSQENVRKKSLVSEVFVVLDSSNSPKIFFDDINGSVEIEDLFWKINSEKDKMSIYEQDQWMPVLFIDGDIPMSYVKELKYRFRKSKVTRAMYATGMKSSKYPSNYAFLRLSGMTHFLGPLYYPELEIFLDSAERMDRTRHTIKFSEHPMHRVAAVRRSNRIEVNLGIKSMQVNGQEVDLDRLRVVIRRFYQKYEGVVIFEVGNDVPYKRYIEVLDVLYWQQDRLRNEMSLELFGEPYEPPGMGQKRNTVLSKYPRAVVEWTKEERRLLKLLDEHATNEYSPQKDELAGK